ncbi:MAG: tetratricopeptide repeat protein [Bacteroidetes bacterium]|nr:tetratricopeptide repeat protein [Bacteroidota bacterium]MBK8487182.1 tetratricopeptide repeat protein [Bacteroidota bacterium]MBK8680568.1 tetratricopeptide repeat protein [Bacteroidota bacterium]
MLFKTHLLQLLIVIAFGIYTNQLFADNEAKELSTIDSLKTTLSISTEDSIHTELLFLIAKKYQAMLIKDSALVYANKALTLAEKIPYYSKQADILLLLGKIELTNFGPRDRPTKNILKSLQIYTELRDNEGIARANLQLGILSFEIQNYNDASRYFLEIINNKNADQNINGTAQYLLALSYSELGEFDNASEMFNLAINNYGGDNPERIMQINSFYGKMFTNKGNYSKAIEILSEIINANPQLKDNTALVPAYAFISTAYLNINEYNQSIKYGSLAVELCKGKGSFGIYLIEAEESLYKAYESTGNYIKAFYYLRDLNNLKDSISSNNILQRITEMKGKYDLQQEMENEKTEQKIKAAIAQQELKRQKQFSNTLGGGLLIVFVLALLLLKQRMRISKEKKRSDTLLLNILPEKTAEELKQTGTAEAKQFEQVSVLFTDFKDFTILSEKLTPTQIVKEMHTCFSAFDAIIEKYNIEKIKTIGDSYMAAVGLPTPVENSAEIAVTAAIEIQAYITHRESELSETVFSKFEMRCGIHTGSVVAGIVGTKKFQYDIWGDTVNTASRMESNGEVGKVNISQSTYNLIKDNPDFIFESRGIINAKGKGDLQMFFVNLKYTEPINSDQLKTV